MKMEANRRRKRLTLLIAVTGISLFITIFDIELPFFKASRSSTTEGHDGRPDGGGRALRTHTTSSFLHWSKDHFVSVKQNPNPSVDTTLFWHIPKSGGTTVKTLYYFCMGLSLANRIGVDPRFGHQDDEEIVVFNIKKRHAVNVDVISRSGIKRAKNLGLVSSKKADIIITPKMRLAGKELFDKENQGRIIALFRHPVERLISLFYYLQVADWEHGYDPSLKGKTLLEWATHNSDHQNIIMKELSGKLSFDELEVAKAVRFMEMRVVVGLTERMEESIRRFNVVMGLDEEKDNVHKCMQEYFGQTKDEKEDNVGTSADKNWDIHQRTTTDRKMNVNVHPKYDESSPEWKVLAEKNKYDVMLFENIVRIFDEQKVIFDPVVLPAHAKVEVGSEAEDHVHEIGLAVADSADYDFGMSMLDLLEDQRDLRLVTENVVKTSSK